MEGELSSEITAGDKARAAALLAKCDTFDDFMQVRYASVKRYGAEVHTESSNIELIFHMACY